MSVVEQTLEEKVQYLIDRTEIYDLVRYERFCRDMLDWDGLQGSFVSGSPVRTTWFDGTIEGFVEGSRAKMSSGSTAKSVSGSDYRTFTIHCPASDTWARKRTSTPAPPDGVRWR